MAECISVTNSVRGPLPSACRPAVSSARQRASPRLAVRPVRVEKRGTKIRGARDTAPAPAQALPSHGVVRWRGRPSPASGCRVSRRDKGRPVWPAAGCPAEGLEEQEHGVLRMARRQLGRGRHALLRRETRGILSESAYQGHDYRRRDAVAVVLILPDACPSCQKIPHPSDIGLRCLHLARVIQDVRAEYEDSSKAAVAGLSSVKSNDSEVRRAPVCSLGAGKDVHDSSAYPDHQFSPEPKWVCRLRLHSV